MIWCGSYIKKKDKEKEKKKNKVFENVDMKYVC